MTVESKSISCYQCGKFITWEHKHTFDNGNVFVYRERFDGLERTDKIFCSDACGAAYHREHGSAHIHADLIKVIPCVCRYCGNVYLVNEYALRGGAREPKYCSTKCRVYAFRDKIDG